MSRRLQL